MVQLLSGVPVINLLSVEQLQGLARAFKVSKSRSTCIHREPFRSIKPLLYQCLHVVTAFFTYHNRVR